MNSAQELIHLIKHACRQEMLDAKTLYFGHVSGYDGVAHAVKVLIPLLQDPDTGAMYETDWMQLGTLAAGPNIGIQYAPYLAAATPTNLYGGEQALIALHDRDNGVGCVIGMTYNIGHAAPGQGHTDGTPDTPGDPLGNNQLQLGEMVIKLPSGSFLKFYANGDIQLNAAHDLNLNAGHNVNIKAGNAITTSPLI